MIYTYIHMYTKRANIMFNQHDWNNLTSLAKKKKTTVGVLVRDAVQQRYMVPNKLEQIAEANKQIRKIRKIFKGTIDYKSLIEEGRRQ